MILLRVLFTTMVLLTLSSCDASRSKTPFIQYRVELDKSEARDLSAFIRNHMLYQGGSRDMDLIFATNSVGDGILNFIVDDDAEGVLTLTLRPIDPDEERGSIKWSYDTKRGEERHASFPATADQVEKVWNLIRTWQTEALP
jgi:hypothetical protein